MIIPDIIIQTTAQCPNHCRYCSIRKWKESKPEYRYTLAQLQNLLDAIKQSGYVVNNIYLGGAEPITWEHLSDAIDLINAQNINVIIYTTGIGAESLIESKKVGTWVITLYDWNYDKVIGFEKYPNVVLNITDHVEYPKGNVANSTPAQCVCSELSVEGDIVYSCHGVRLNGYDYADSGRDYSKYYTDVSPGFMDRISRDIFSMDLCERCISNKNIKFISHKIFRR